MSKEECSEKGSAQFKASTDTANKKPIMQLVSKPDAAEVLGAAIPSAGLAPGAAASSAGLAT